MSVNGFHKNIVVADHEMSVNILQECNLFVTVCEKGVNIFKGHLLFVTGWEISVFYLNIICL